MAFAFLSEISCDIVTVSGRVKEQKKHPKRYVSTTFHWQPSPAQTTPLDFSLHSVVGGGLSVFCFPPQKTSSQPLAYVILGAENFSRLLDPSSTASFRLFNYSQTHLSAIFAVEAAREQKTKQLQPLKPQIAIRLSNPTVIRHRPNLHTGPQSKQTRKSCDLIADYMCNEPVIVEDAFGAAC